MEIKRYLKLFLKFISLSFQTEVTFRGNAAFWTINNLLWLLLVVVGINLIYGQIDAIAGWDHNEAILLILISSLFYDFLWTFVFRNLYAISDLIRLGQLDNTLLKPVNTRFLLSFFIIEYDHWVRIILEIYLIYRYTLINVGNISPAACLISIFLFFCGLVIFYSLFFAAMMTNIWFIRLSNLVDFFDGIKGLGDRPVYIFKRKLLFIFSYLLPVGYIATFPAEALLGRLSSEKIIIAPILAGVFYWLSDNFFRFALRHYSSASS